MTVRELRELLFQVEDQEQEIRMLIGNAGDWGIEKIEKSWSVFTGDFISIEPINKDLIKIK